MNELIELKGKINRVFEDLMGRGDPSAGAAGPGEWTPRIDLYELPDRVVLRADVPGVKREDLEIRLEGGQLLVRGRREQPADLDPSSLCRMERQFGGFTRRYALPESIDPERVRASCREGVLEIVLGKRETAEARKIPVGNE